MSVMIEMGSGAGGAAVTMDLEELLATRLLVQGNSGSGKSHLLRRLLEESAGVVQQIIIDPEGDFVSLDEFGHLPIDATGYSHNEIAKMASRVREHRASCVLSLEGLEMDAQMRCAATFLSALFDAPRDHWYPALVVVDEAQVFAPSAAGEVSDEARRLSLGAMTNLMCRGRKRGLAGIIATQRLAKLAKNVAAEASNFLMGRTFLDIDMARASDLLGMERRQAEQIRDLQRGEFLALGPALSRRPVNVKIGPVRTSARSSSPKLVPLPKADAGFGDLFSGLADAPPPPPPPPVPRPTPTEDMLRALESAADSPRQPSRTELLEVDEETRARIIDTALAGVVAEAGSQPLPVLYQDFGVRCRMLGLAGQALDLPAFRRRLAMAKAGIPADAEGWDGALALADIVPEDMHPVLLLLARTARERAPCPTDEELARIYGTSSTARLRRVLAFLEEQHIIVTRIDLSGKRSVTLPSLGWTTAPSEAEHEKPQARVARRR
ncbi:ATP-binding protein [Sphingosinicella sp. BN140058]|uniref:ATP-binding protein n=1 Tax=Sphingosinicella sp. BN140058 TaxID=1892855 RepID=UPI00101017A9|nr:ATP-binding protein [Sphingosinicella sp. BN140058]QAY77351.1 ATP-binding protein [Sphingosinicella sp. BN140058]